MNEIFNLENQWLMYLKRAEVSELNLPALQRQEMRRAFFGAIGQIVIHLRDDLPDSEEGSVAIFESIMSQVLNFWMQEQSNNDNHERRSK